MAYKVCGPATNCLGDTTLSIEDAASPVTIAGRSGGGTVRTAVAKPVADVINLSLGDTAGDPTSATSRAANNAALAGTIVVASAGNAGPGPSTLGAPSVATLAISVAAGLDPGSLASSDVLAPGQIPGETKTLGTPGPPPVTGTTSENLTPQPNERRGIKLFPVAGGGAVPGGSISAHYVYVDETPPNTPPQSVTNRIALVKGSGAFANIANEIAPLKPAAILIITTVESATALVVTNGIPTFTINPNDANYLLDIIGGGFNRSDTPNGTIAQYPLRVSENTPFDVFQPGVAGFSSRGPEGNANARYRAVKPDVIAPGVAILGAATPDGLQDATTGLSNPTGYVQASGTSFAGPITAGAMALVRQHVREDLALDTTSLNDPQYTTKRFDSVTVARALLTNTSTNLRSAFGVVQADGTSTAAINEVGAGLINIAGALQAKAIMVASTPLRSDEYTPGATPTPSPSASPSPTPMVLIPSVSFGAVPAVNVDAVIVRTREVLIRDVTNGSGAGSYALSFQNNRNTDIPGVQLSFLSADGSSAITSVDVPANGTASFLVRVAVDGNQVITDPTELQWYVTATQNSTGNKLRMPFYYRAVAASLGNVVAPNQGPITETEPTPTPTASPTPTPTATASPSATPTATPNCPSDTNGNYTINFTYTGPSGGPKPVGFRVQEATRSESKFFDNASEVLQAGANSKWTGSAQWESQPNPDTGSLAYFIPDGANQNESLAMKTAVALPTGGATLSFVTRQDLEDTFDFGYVEISTDSGASYSTVAAYTGTFSGTRSIDISGFSGNSIIVRFRMKSDLANDSVFVGWHIDDIRVSSDDFKTVANLDASATSVNITGRYDGTYFYRVAGLFNTPEGVAPGPYSNTRCVTVSGNPLPPPNFGALQFNAATYAIGENGGSAVVTVTRSGGTAGTVTVDYATSDGSANAGSDYTAAAGTLTFGPGEASKQFTVPIIDDNTPENDETVNLTLSNPTGGATLGTPAAAVLTIIDDQGPPVPGTLQFSASNYTASEDAGNITVTVTRRGGSDGTVTVTYSTSDGSAAANSDYVPTSGTLTFGPGEVTKSFTVGLIDDPSAEPDEAFIVTLSNPSGGATLASPSSATIMILDTDRGGPPAQLLNISTRVHVQGGEKVGIGGFIVTGNGNKRVLLRGIGPSLAVNGTPLEGRLQDPVIQLFDKAGQLLATNDNWKDSPERADIEASGLAPSDDAESAIARTLAAGEYTVVISGKSGSQGIGLVEAYDRDGGGASELANISTRGFVGTNDDVLIGGFIAGSRSGATNVVGRGIGPTLASKGVAEPLQDPTLQLFDTNGALLDSSDNWKDSTDATSVSDRGLAPGDDRESAAFQTVPPGQYTVVIRGKENATGVALVEVYNVQ